MENSKHRLIIIYLPNGNDTAKYCTKDINPGNSGEYKLAEEITCDVNEVKVFIKEDDKLVGRAYVGMPYYLEMF